MFECLVDELTLFVVQVFETLQPIMNIPIIFSEIDRSVNLDKKGKGKETLPILESSSEIDSPAQEAEEETNCPPDGISSLPIAPTPIGLVPSEDLPLPSTTIRHSTTKYAFDLPAGVEMSECGIFYIGEESLSLNNILIINGKCPVSTLSR